LSPRPLTGLLLVQRDKTYLERNFKEFLASLIVKLRLDGYTVHNAHEREHWGEKLFTPEQALIGDLSLIDFSDIVLALMGDPPSPGVQLEIGYSIAKLKTILLFHTQPFAEIPYLCQGIESISTAKIIPLSTRTFTKEAIRPILESVQQVELDKRIVV
jgi:hypothetical protein